MIRSRDNAQVKHWAKLARDGRYRRKEGKALIEGPHLVAACLARGVKPLRILVGEKRNPEIDSLVEKARSEVVEIADGVLRGIADAETPQGIAAEIEIPAPRPVRGDCVFLEGIQDAGNVGAIIRSAAAFGIVSLIVDNACADPWSPKVLRAGAGGHFTLVIRAVPSLKTELESFSGKLLCTAVAAGASLREADLSGRLGWVFGSEGRGLSAEALREADLQVTIPIAPSTQSLNVAAAAAVCLYAAFNRPGGGC